jgi:acetyl esterase
MKRNTLSVAILFGLCMPLAGQTSENNDRLKKAFERFPAADADKDGVLTLGEAKAFKAKMEGKGEAPGEGKAKASNADRKVTYKTVGGTELSLHIFEPEGHKRGDKVPAIVFFHGGGWAKGDPSQFTAQCEYLAGRGMVAISAQYRLISKTGVKIEDCVEDAKSAMRWVRGHAARLGIDPEQIASGGGSAGGHLGACVQLVDTLDAETDDNGVSAKPNAMILFNPAMLTSPDPRMEKEGATPADMKERGSRLAKSLRGEPAVISPLTYAKSEQPPCIMFFGTADALLKSAEWFRDDSVAAGNSCRIVTYEGQGHSFFNRTPYMGKTLAELDKFLVGLGWLEAE